MRMKSIILATTLLSTPTLADEHLTDPCEGSAAFVCAALAIPVTIAIIDEMIDAACPEAYPPGEWPEDALASRPAYKNQWYRGGCNFNADDLD